MVCNVYIRHYSFLILQNKDDVNITFSLCMHNMNAESLALWMKWRSLRRKLFKRFISESERKVFLFLFFVGINHVKKRKDENNRAKDIYF